MACRLSSIMPLFKLMLTDCQLNHQEQTSVKFASKWKKMHWKHCLQNVVHIFPALMCLIHIRISYLLSVTSHLQTQRYLQYNRCISQMQVPLAPCRVPAGSYDRLLNVLYGFEHKTHISFNPCPLYPHCGILTCNMPHTFGKVKFVIISPCFV